jgi:hypothetical protein
VHPGPDPTHIAEGLGCSIGIIYSPSLIRPSPPARGLAIAPALVEGRVGTLKSVTVTAAREPLAALRANGGGVCRRHSVPFQEKARRSGPGWVHGAHCALQ